MAEPTPAAGPGTNTGHGHVWPRPDGSIARCGGPKLCKKCARDLAAYGPRPTTWARPGPTRHILSWDWKEQPDLRALAQLVNEVSGGRVHITEAETGSDQYAIVIADHPVSDTDAAEAYRADLMGDDA
jgi:hypothetical protein